MVSKRKALMMRGESKIFLPFSVGMFSDCLGRFLAKLLNFLSALICIARMWGRWSLMGALLLLHPEHCIFVSIGAVASLDKDGTET